MKNPWQDLEQQLAGLDFAQYPKWFAKQRQQALADFQTHGLPHAKLDWWRQTPLKKIFAEDATALVQTSKAVQADLPFDAYVIHVDGDKVTWDFKLPGLSILPIIEAVQANHLDIQQYLGQAYPHRDGLAALNTLMFQRGLYIHAAPNLQLDKTLCIYHHRSSAAVGFSRHVIAVGENASLRVLEIFADAADTNHFMHHVSESVLAADASFQHLILQDCPERSRFFAEVAVRQHSASQYNGFLMQKGGHIASCDYWIDLVEEHATVNMSGLFRSQGQQFHQQRLQVNHLVPHCYSTQNFRGILDDQAEGVFMGQVLVAHAAQKTHAHQTNKNLVLSKQAKMFTSPQLQIFADDVVCSHGATVGQLDEEAMFYLQSRGFSAEEAKRSLVQAFVWAQFDVIAETKLRQWCMDQLYT